MTEPRFTPGPWKVCRSNEDFDGPFYELDDDDYERPINAIRSKSETIAGAHDLFEFNEANAHLIAAGGIDEHGQSVLVQMLEELDTDLEMLEVWHGTARD